MKLQIYSDLHLEFADFTPPRVERDVVVLAGDVHVGTRALAWIARHHHDVPVVYVCGNHEHYRGNLDRTVEKLRAKSWLPNLHVLDRDAVVLGGVRFLGATLWTDFALHGDARMGGALAGEFKNDYRVIRCGTTYRRLRPRDTAAEHAESRLWLHARLAEPFDGKTVVVSHHAPSEASFPPEERGKSLNPAYASDLAEVAARGVDLWIHGHIHHSADHRLGSTRVVSNPRGYPEVEENPDFDPGFVLEL
ncbi:MAG: metallophosphoesterase family protein [Planctomycetes bacterium]|nr:metallophosphoesterase family protein [Planctomycetota bacterium]